jgi:hypothetical protein
VPSGFIESDKECYGDRVVKYRREADVTVPIS